MPSAARLRLAGKVIDQRYQSRPQHTAKTKPRKPDIENAGSNIPAKACLLCSREYA